MNIKIAKMLTMALGVLLSCSTAANSTATPVPNTIEAELLDRLASATNELDGRKVEGQIWEFWFNEASRVKARKLLDQGRQRREAYDYAAAEVFFSELIVAEPGYAEGYNQRAFVRFLREDTEGALADLEVTLQMKPWHFGALSGMYHVLRLQNRHSAAFTLLQQAVEIHPWIQERGALPRDMWPESYRLIHEPGQEI